MSDKESFWEKIKGYVAPVTGALGAFLGIGGDANPFVSTAYADNPWARVDTTTPGTPRPVTPTQPTQPTSVHGYASLSGGGGHSRLVDQLSGVADAGLSVGDEFSVGAGVTEAVSAAEVNIPGPTRDVKTTNKDLELRLTFDWRNIGDTALSAALAPVYRNQRSLAELNEFRLNQEDDSAWGTDARVAWDLGETSGISLTGKGRWTNGSYKVDLSDELRLATGGTRGYDVGAGLTLSFGFGKVRNNAGAEVDVARAGGNFMNRLPGRNLPRFYFGASGNFNIRKDELEQLDHLNEAITLGNYSTTRTIGYSIDFFGGGDWREYTVDGGRKGFALDGKLSVMLPYTRSEGDVSAVDAENIAAFNPLDITTREQKLVDARLTATYSPTGNIDLSLTLHGGANSTESRAGDVKLGEDIKGFIDAYLGVEVKF